MSAANLGLLILKERISATRMMVIWPLLAIFHSILKLGSFRSKGESSC